jgi:hypothetical protein
MNQASRRASLVLFTRRALLLWAALVAAYAIWAFLIPHEFVFGPEIGAIASFVFFVVAYSVPYLFGAVVLYLGIVRPSNSGGARNDP